MQADYRPENYMYFSYKPKPIRILKESIRIQTKNFQYLDPNVKNVKDSYPNGTDQTPPDDRMSMPKMTISKLKNFEHMK